MSKKRVRKVIFREQPRKSNHRAPTHDTQSQKKQNASSALDGSRFRWLNESLYTESSSKSFELFQTNPNLFSVYHSGFRSQTTSWPVNPVDECLEYIKKTIAAHSNIGDFGCGDAKLAQLLKDTMTVHSFDLVSVNSLVTACNIADVPLDSGSLDFAVFSLSLMGTDWPKFIAEAQRCLRIGGTLYIAEVQSRVTDFDKFRDCFKGAFSVVKAENSKDKYFVKLILKKTSDSKLNIDSTLLKPCLYKKR